MLDWQRDAAARCCPVHHILCALWLRALVLCAAAVAAREEEAERRVSEAAGREQVAYDEARAAVARAEVAEQVRDIVAAPAFGADGGCQ